MHESSYVHFDLLLDWCATQMTTTLTSLQNCIRVKSLIKERQTKLTVSTKFTDHVATLEDCVHSILSTYYTC